MRSSSFHVFVLFLAAIVAWSAPAATSPVGGKTPWSWTAKERAQRRSDPTLRAERVRLAKENRDNRRAAVAPADREPADVIDGKRNPELFFATELFERLVFNSFVSMPKSYPRVIAQETDDLFRDPSEWNRFEEVVRDFSAILAAERAHLDRSISGGLPADVEQALGDVRRSKCAAKARALRTSRHAFGRERFDRFLYLVVARGITSTYLDSQTLAQSTAAALRHEEACQ